jgi:secreted PhoX family phosphatase
MGLFQKNDGLDYPVTPDGRYFVVKGRLWRCTNPALSAEDRNTFVRQLMSARRAVRFAMRTHDPQALKLARNAVNEAKIALGERGAAWWTDGAQDHNRKHVSNSPYAAWYADMVLQN